MGGGVLVWQEVGIPCKTCTEVGKKKGSGCGDLAVLLTLSPPSCEFGAVVCVCVCVIVFLGRGACCNFR